jgi:mannose-1-phosphate guanylyltransferase
MASLHAVIMAGGSGTRFWPASRKRRPKQFLPLLDGKAMLAATVERIEGLCPPGHCWIVTNRQQANRVRRLLPSFPVERILVEPTARDTAPCLALATAAIARQDPAATMVVLPADHLIEPRDAFERMLQRGIALATRTPTLVTFGVRPTHPATGYGYIECGATCDALLPRACAVQRFREKPDAGTAAQFLANGNFLWNSGIFVWTVPAIRAAMASAAPELAAATDRLVQALASGRPAAIRSAFLSAPKTSIDYAVLERAPRVTVVEATIRWNDLGSFPALADIGTKDAAGNAAVLADGASMTALASEQNLVYAEGRRTVALFGVQDLVVVAVGDAVLVCPRDRASELKTLVDHLAKHGRKDLL